MKKQASGFTVIELLIVAFIFGAASILFFVQKNNIQVLARDEARKNAINSIYYSLEEVFYKQNKYYPSQITSDILPSVDPDLLNDINDIPVGQSGSEYSYNPTDCKDNKCASYSLKATMENEADYIKNSRN